MHPARDDNHQAFRRRILLQRERRWHVTGTPGVPRSRIRQDAASASVVSQSPPKSNI
jgi:hypothetical protein